MCYHLPHRERGSAPPEQRGEEHTDTTSDAGSMGIDKIPTPHAWRRVASRLLWAAVVFLIIGLVTALFGFGGMASTAAGIAKLRFFLFVVIFIIMLVLGLVGARRVV
jgi:uncharacterized membrane protein YtjA (UPF0391 family)